jgi:carboxyl-terminal processing protease
MMARLRPAKLLFVPLAAVALLCFHPVMVRAQVRIPAEALPDEAELQRLLEQGHELEAQHRWGEALSHYEEVVRDYPERRELQQRLTRARIHYDLARRYQDQSYTSWLNHLTEHEAAVVYSEVLRKIESHYVKPPDWQDLVQRGVDNLTAALHQPAFLQAGGSPVSDSAANAFCDQVQRRMKVTVVNNQRDATDVAMNVAHLARQQLGVRPQAVILEFTCGAACALDPYSSFLTSGQLEDVFSQIEGNFVGLGIELKADQQSLLIVNVIPGGPAEEAGVRQGERIVEVNGISTASITTDEAAELLKGPEGSAVQLSLRDDRGFSRGVRLVRRRVEVPSVEGAKILDGGEGIAYLRLASFQKTTSRDFDAVLWKLHRQGMRALIVDVRGNPGGLLTAAVEVADKFINAGTIVSTRGRNSHEDFDYRAHSIGTWGVPLIVLIDRDTASASEIFAGAVRDNRRGTVVGQRSYGKGSVQGIFSLNTAKAGVRLTTAKFYSPNGQPISHRGVNPDVVVRTARKPLAEGAAPLAPDEDAVLAAAVRLARSSQLSQRQP